MDDAQITDPNKRQLVDSAKTELVNSGNHLLSMVTILAPTAKGKKNFQFFLLVKKNIDAKCRKTIEESSASLMKAAAFLQSASRAAQIGEPKLTQRKKNFFHDKIF